MLRTAAAEIRQQESFQTPLEMRIDDQMPPVIASHCVGCLALAATLFVAGCNAPSAGKTDPQVLAEYRQQLLLSEEPAGAMSVLDLRENLLQEASQASEAGGTSEAAESRPPVPESVVVVGRVGGVPNPWRDGQPDFPWVPGEAHFFVADAAAAAEIEAQGHDHGGEDHADCPFCAKAAKSDVLCAVRFVDDHQQPIPIDARELFELSGDEMVVIKGTPTVLGSGDDALLIVDAASLYVRR